MVQICTNETLLASNTVAGHLPSTLTAGKSYRVLKDGSFKDDSNQKRNAKHFLWETRWEKAFRTTEDTLETQPSPLEHYLSSGAQTPPVEPPRKLTRKELVAMSKAFGHQEDGHHYTDMELQPLEATYLRYGLIGLQAAIHTKVDKYITRKKDDALIQLKKAQHCLEILTEMTELEKTYAN